MTTAIDSVEKLGQDNVEIVMKAFGSLSNGIQAVASEIAAYNKTSFERGAAVVQDLAGARSAGQALDPDLLLEVIVRRFRFRDQQAGRDLGGYRAGSHEAP